MAENIEMSETSADDMRKILDRQKRAYLNDGVVSNEVRHDRLERAVNVIKKNEEKLVDAMSTDFGHRSHHHAYRDGNHGQLRAVMPTQCEIQQSQRPRDQRTQRSTSQLFFETGAKFEALVIPKAANTIACSFICPLEHLSRFFWRGCP